MYHEYTVQFLLQHTLADLLLDAQRTSASMTLRKAHAGIRPQAPAVRRRVANSVFDLANTLQRA
jgi:hypothetical protein